jgi:hypothetical protein
MFSFLWASEQHVARIERTNNGRVIMRLFNDPYFENSITRSDSGRISEKKSI